MTTQNYDRIITGEKVKLSALTDWLVVDGDDLHIGIDEFVSPQNSLFTLSEGERLTRTTPSWVVSDGTTYVRKVIRPVPHLGDLADVEVDEAAPGDVVAYNNGRWVLSQLTTGPSGPSGPAGTSVRIIGSLSDPSDLDNVTGQETGDGYLIQGNLWVWDGSEWDNVGTIQGPTGEVGPTGPTGPSGDQGDQGTQGIQGDPGPSGPTGTQGDVGPTGPPGIQGDAGATGSTGPSGPSGPQGDPGPSGSQGEVGPSGPIGATGPTGDPGPSGATGDQGEQGVQGPSGPSGPSGPQGPTGDQGIAGPTGEAGPSGPSGPSGSQGIQGPSGPSGPNGPSGPQGEVGATGPSGVSGPSGPSGPQPPLASATPTSVTTGATGAAGGATDAARADHTHALGSGLVESLIPTGAVMAWPTLSAPSGWLICSGQAVSRSTYSGLFAVISVQYGTGDGSTTFNLPNLKGKVPVGYDVDQDEFDAINEQGGSKTHTLTTSEIPAHSHTTHATQAANTTATGGQNRLTTLAGTGGANTGTTSNTGGGGAHNNLQPYIVLVYIIKT